MFKINKLRKRVTVIGVSMLTLALLATGCGSQAGGSQSSKGTEEKPMNLTILGGRAGGVWSVFTEGVAESIRKSNKGSIVTVEPGSTTGNPGLVNQGKVPFGMAYSLTAYEAYKGLEPYDSANPNLRSVAVIIPKNLYQFTVSEKTGLTSIQEIKDKKFPLKISVDDKGSMADIITRAVFKAHGFTYQDIESWGGKVFNLDGGKSYEMMADGRMDAAPDALPAPSGDILEASATQKLNILKLSDEAIAKVSEELKMGKGTVQKGTYKFLDYDVPTVNTPVILLVNKDVPDDEVYRVAKSIYSNFEYLYTVHESLKDLNKDNIADVGGVPLHPGAEKFLKEIGALK